MVIRPDKNALDRVSTRWTALNGQSLISLTRNYPHQQLIDKQLEKNGVVCKRGKNRQSLGYANRPRGGWRGHCDYPSFGLAACRSRKVTMSELVEPFVTLDVYGVSQRGTKLPDEAVEFSTFLKWYIATWAGVAGML